jgi:hypothetical protein
MYDGCVCVAPILTTCVCGWMGRRYRADWSVISSSADPNPDDPEPSVLLKLKDNGRGLSLAYNRPRV